MSSSIPSWQILTAHAQTFRGATDLAFCLKVPLDSLLVWASSEGSGETARMRRLAWTFAARIGDKYQIRLTRSICFMSRLIFNRWKKFAWGQIICQRKNNSLFDKHVSLLIYKFVSVSAQFSFKPNLEPLHSTKIKTKIWLSFETRHEKTCLCGLLERPENT